MLSIKHLKHESCPDCGAQLVGISISDLHSNGQQFETIKFECGSAYRWVPNFSAEEKVHSCPRSKQERDKLFQRQTELERLKSFVNKLKVDHVFMETIQHQISFIRFW